MSTNADTWWVLWPTARCSIKANVGLLWGRATRFSATYYATDEEAQRNADRLNESTISTYF